MNKLSNYNRPDPVFLTKIKTRCTKPGGTDFDFRELYPAYQQVPFERAKHNVACFASRTRTGGRGSFKPHQHHVKTDGYKIHIERIEGQQK